VVVLGVRFSTKSTVHALRAALVRMVTPLVLLAPSALKKARVWFHSNDLAREIAEVNELTNEGGHIGATHGVMDVNHAVHDESE
jgi:hypothetical protein